MTKLTHVEQFRLKTLAKALVKEPRNFEVLTRSVPAERAGFRDCVESMRVAFLIAFTPELRVEDEDETLDAVVDMLTHSGIPEVVEGGFAIALAIAQSYRRTEAFLRQRSLEPQ